MADLYPLRFRPILRRYIWGGRRLESILGKQLGTGDDYAESWEICDRGPDQSVVGWGPLAETTLHDLLVHRGAEILGRHHPRDRFPLLMKFLDATRTLSVQVHPNDAQAALLDPPDLGKSEAWVVLAAEPGSLIYAGLKPGVDRADLADAIRQGTCQDCLHRFEPAVGDCVFLPAGTVHALGEGLLVAEIQQSSDTTYRLFDWNRLGTDAEPRALHVAAAMEVIDFDRPPVEPQEVRSTDRPGVGRLVQCDKFVLDRWQFDSPQAVGGDGRCHVLTVIEGAVTVAADQCPEVLASGSTVFLPAAIGETLLTPQGSAVLLDAYLP